MNIEMDLLFVLPQNVLAVKLSIDSDFKNQSDSDSQRLESIWSDSIWSSWMQIWVSAIKRTVILITFLYFTDLIMY